MNLQASDGIQCAARLYRPREPQPPGLVLVHGLGAASASWDPFALRAQFAGYMVIALDLRGHGDSREQSGATLDYRAFDDGAWLKTLLDVDAARKRLLEAGADPNNLFIAGEALGASLALRYAIENFDIQGLVMLSPGLNYKGLDALALIQQYVDRPALLIWADGDAYAASSAASLKQAARGHIEVHAYPGTAHGTNLFSTAPQSMGQILVWLEQMVSPGSPTASASGPA